MQVSGAGLGISIDRTTMAGLEAYASTISLGTLQTFRIASHQILLYRDPTSGLLLEGGNRQCRSTRVSSPCENRN